MKRIKMTNVCGSKRNVKPGVMIADRTGRAGSIPGCVFLAAADVGRAAIGRKRVWTTWGRNIPAERIESLIGMGFSPIWMGASDGSVELVIPDEIANKITPMMI